MYNTNTKIGVLGSGDVGRVLATAFLYEGHQVMLGTRNKEKEEVIKWMNENPHGESGTFQDTAVYGQILILAVPGVAAEDVIKMAGIENFSGKIVIDATNPIAKDPPANGVLKFFTTLESSLMENIQNLIQNAHIVKCFNSVGSHLMYKPHFSEGKPTMFICGNNDEAKETVTAILYVFGWEAEDMGKAEAARAIEPLCILWCIPGFLRNQWGHAFKLLKA
jgi:predicted dinucleotide-binding enzyme